MAVGNKIKKIREFRNFTQEHMADKLKMSVSGYSRIERDEVNIPIQRMEEIAQILDVKLDEILSFNEKVIFSNNQFTHSNGLNINSALSEKERLLYDAQIEALKKTITALEGQIELLKK